MNDDEIRVIQPGIGGGFAALCRQATIDQLKTIAFARAELMRELSMSDAIIRERLGDEYTGVVVHACEHVKQWMVENPENPLAKSMAVIVELALTALENKTKS